MAKRVSTSGGATLSTVAAAATCQPVICSSRTVPASRRAPRSR
jgi:hypothetical protein